MGEGACPPFTDKSGTKATYPPTPDSLTPSKASTLGGKASRHPKWLQEKSAEAVAWVGSQGPAPRALVPRALTEPRGTSLDLCHGQELLQLPPRGHRASVSDCSATPEGRPSRSGEGDRAVMPSAVLGKQQPLLQSRSSSHFLKVLKTCFPQQETPARRAAVPPGSQGSESASPGLPPAATPGAQVALGTGAGSTTLHTRQEPVKR